MKTVCLVSCVSAKTQERSPASVLYTSPLFKKARAYATSRFDDWSILSAKYGLTSPDQVIDPYDQTLKHMPKDARLAWARGVVRGLQSTFGTDTLLAFVAGTSYREYIIPELTCYGYATRVPLEGLSIGMQLSWLKQLEDERQRLRHLDTFYELLRTLETSCAGKRILSNCTGQMEWPEMGVYFFFEPNEYRTSAVDQERVVMVGAHSVGAGAQSTLWNRLRTHRGRADGSGNHRDSIFRLHVGASLLNRSPKRTAVRTWGVGQSATQELRTAELFLENQVSATIGAMSLLWLAVADEPSPTSDRAYIQKNAIALISGPTGPLDLARPTWLGRFGDRKAIRKSGLWNVDYVDEPYDPRFLETMAVYVDAMQGKVRTPNRSIAPTDWPTRRRPTDISQLGLFEGD